MIITSRKMITNTQYIAFVYGGKLNAISQYDHYAVYPHLDPLKEKIQEMVSSKKQVCRHHLTL
jgi:hypothetical protein